MKIFENLNHFQNSENFKEVDNFEKWNQKLNVPCVAGKKDKNIIFISTSKTEQLPSSIPVNQGLFLNFWQCEKLKIFMHWLTLVWDFRRFKWTYLPHELSLKKKPPLKASVWPGEISDSMPATFCRNSGIYEQILWCILECFIVFYIIVWFTRVVTLCKQLLGTNP